MYEYVHVTLSSRIIQVSYQHCSQADKNQDTVEPSVFLTLRSNDFISVKFLANGERIQDTLPTAVKDVSFSTVQNIFGLLLSNRSSRVIVNSYCISPILQPGTVVQHVGQLLALGCCSVIYCSVVGYSL